MRRDIKKLMDTCIKINETTKTDVFFSISPHVEGIAIHAYRNGWDRGGEPEFHNTIYYSGELMRPRKIMVLQEKLNRYLV